MSLANPEMGWWCRAATCQIVVIGLLATGAQARAAAPETLLDFCVANPKVCAISVFSIDEGWERHLNPDRPQVLAATMKIVMLIAYAQAVVDGAISPDATMSRDEWARYQTLDGGALKSAWEELGKPQNVSWQDLARMMIRYSDNSTPDHLIATLGSKRIRKALKVVGGFHDTPAAISGSGSGRDRVTK
jgi:beta-lactamase class A